LFKTTRLLDRVPYQILNPQLLAAFLLTTDFTERFCIWLLYLPYQSHKWN